MTAPMVEPVSSREETQRKMRELAERLKRDESKQVIGAPSREPHGQHLDFSLLEKQNPDYHYRLVNMTDPQKIQNRRNRGYVPVSQDEANVAGLKASVGNELVLMKIPRDEYDRQVASVSQLTKSRLKAHKAEMRRIAEGIVRELRDKHGLDVDLDRILVDED